MFRTGRAGQPHLSSQPGLKAIEMWWLDDIVIPALFIFVIYCFVVCVGFRTRMLTPVTQRIRSPGRSSLGPSQLAAARHWVSARHEGKASPLGRQQFGDRAALWDLGP